MVHYILLEIYIAYPRFTASLTKPSLDRIAQLFSGSVDKSVRVWDIRNVRAPTKQLNGHEFAVRRIKSSPYNPRTLATASYDMSLCIWDVESEDSIVARYEHHTEFVLGVDFNNFVENRMASTGWDNTVRVWTIADAYDRKPFK